MAVAPRNGDCVVSHCRKVTNLGVSAFAILDCSGVSLAFGARAEATQHVVWIDRIVAVGPVDMHDGCAVWSFDSHGE